MCVSCDGVLCVQVGGGVSGRVGTTLDAIQLSIFSHRFMSTAEQMGRSPDNHMTCEQSLLYLSFISTEYSSVHQYPPISRWVWFSVYCHFLVHFPYQERLDFSCALFGPDGGLVANAPHIPVHLGAMQETVQYQVTIM